MYGLPLNLKHYTRDKFVRDTYSSFQVCNEFTGKVVRSSSLSETIWYCTGCDTYHPEEYPKVMFMSSDHQYKLMLHYCVYHVENHPVLILGCVQCGSPNRKGYTIDMMYENGNVIMFHCSKRCLKITSNECLSPNSVEVRCDNCGIYFANDQMKKCSRCYGDYYCSTKCQREHWPEHKQQCTDVK
jgi:hypothetical protein